MQLPKAADLLKQSWEIFKQKIKILVLIQLVPFVAALPVIFLMGALGLTDETGGPAAGEFDMNKLILALILLFAAVAAGLIQLWAQIAMILAIDNPDAGQKFKEVFRRAQPLIMPYLWVSFLTGLIVAGGLILLVVPGIIFGIWYSLGTYVLALEGQRGMNALRTSKNYVKGNTGELFSRYAVVILLALAIYLVPDFVLQSIGLKALGDVYSGAVSLVFSPVVVIYSYLIYRGLRDAHLPAPLVMPSPVASAPQNSQTV